MDAQQAPEAPLLPVPTAPGPLWLAEAVARRMCHDFAGLLGTLNGLTELSADDAEAAVLARETARRLAARLQLLRGAWGGGGDDLDAPTLLALAEGLPGAERLRVECMAMQRALQDTEARLCLCLLLAAAGGMPRGGTISVGTGTGELWVALEGVRATWPAALAGDCDVMDDARHLPGSLCRMLAAAGGWTISVEGMRAVARRH